MSSYVALLRGIMPQNPNMRNEKLRKVFDGLGYTNVQTVIASGNVTFESKIRDTKKLEASIEKALTKELGLKSAAIVRSKESLEKLLKSNPFKKLVHGKKTYLIITFLKNGKEIASVVDTSTAKTPDLMRKLEKAHGKDITTRTWKTVERVVAKLEK